MATTKWPKGTYHDVEQPCNVPMVKRLQDVYLPLQVLQQLVAKTASVHGLDGHSLMRFLQELP